MAVAERILWTFREMRCMLVSEHDPPVHTAIVSEGRHVKCAWRVARLEDADTVAATLLAMFVKRVSFEPT